MKKTIIGIALAAVGFLGLVWLARPNPQSGAASLRANSVESLIAEEESFDFGTISMAAGNVAHTFKIRNAGDESVTIGKMYTSCMCTTARLEIGDKKLGPYGMPGHGSIPAINEALVPGEEAAVEVVFDPAAHGPAGVGRIERSVTIENSAGEPIEFEFAAFVTP